MPTIERIRELCLLASQTKGLELHAVLLELTKALELYDKAQEKNGNKAAGA